eukprot:TRINITY_DN876_c0_g2_i1.p1 TRINITY_DN876_c0_g2~~TRINITY_DN876_c0_g2_i1.p1  ORF type:complete len:348 (-),score=56.35 TRINITY_DN876_c0_g2_i1:63-1106(-)
MLNSKRESVIGTNDDATSSKLSAVDLGYYTDPFLNCFVRKPSRRPPLINRGYCARVLALEEILKTFCNSCVSSLNEESRNVQIVSLGAGFDTTFWRMKNKGEFRNVYKYVEVDFPEVVKRKLAIIDKTKVLKDATDSTDGNQIYHILGLDLCNVLDLDKMILSTGLNTSLPTLFISECVLVYLPGINGSNIIKWVAEKFPVSGFVTYDIIHPNDPFGKVMVSNLEAKGCPLLSIAEFHDIPTQKQRYTSQGWNRVEILDMNDIYDHYISADVKRRIETIEHLDELEEWVLIQSHYIYVWAMNDNRISNNNNNSEERSKSASFWDNARFEECARGKPKRKVPTHSFMM